MIKEVTVTRGLTGRETKKVKHKKQSKHASSFTSGSSSQPDILTAILGKVEDTQQWSLGRRIVTLRLQQCPRQQLSQSSHEVPIRVVSGEELPCQ